MDATIFTLGSLAGGIGVALGAFGAHALRSRLSPDRLANFETGVRYEIYHALSMLAAAFAGIFRPGSTLPLAAGWLFLSGIVLFSGSLYLLALTGQRKWGAVTPFGGLAFIAGWICLAIVPF